MQDKRKSLAAKIQEYHFELRHVMVLFIILVGSQIIISISQRSSLQNFLFQTQGWYQRDSAERFANLTATSLELLLETTTQEAVREERERQKLIQAFNIIFSQQLLMQHVDEACVLVSQGGRIFAIDNGDVLYRYFFESLSEPPAPELPHPAAIQMYSQYKDSLRASEKILSVLEGRQTFHVFVPFIPKGEFAGVLYIKNAPDFGFITQQIFASFSESSLLFTGMILLGFIFMFFISSYTVQERDDAHRMLYREREAQLKERIDHQKETQFTKRIYHTHHKAEKVMGFIKEDLHNISSNNIEEVKYRVTKYANFISRVIYDMKWYEPPLQTIRNQLFRTDLNEVVTFIVEHICMRVARHSDLYAFQLDLDPAVPAVPVNEFVVWEILEPLLQNAMDHSGQQPIRIMVQTKHFADQNLSKVFIVDDGPGIPEELLQVNSEGIKRLFLENISTKENHHNSGYGCYLAFEIARQRCGWYLDAANLPGGGCRFTLTIPHEGRA